MQPTKLVPVMMAACFSLSAVHAQVATCDPVVWSGVKGVPGPYDRADLARFSSQLGISGLSAEPYAGKGFVYRDYMACVLEKEGPRGRALNQMALDVQHATARRLLAMSTAAVSAFGVDKLASAKLVKLGTRVATAYEVGRLSFDPIGAVIDLPPTRTQAIDRLVTAAYGNLRSRNIKADAQAVYDYLESEANRPNEGPFEGIDLKTRDEILLNAKARLWWILGGADDMEKNARFIEGLMPAELGGFPPPKEPLREAARDLVKRKSEREREQAKASAAREAAVLEAEKAGNAELRSVQTQTDEQLWEALRSEFPGPMSVADQRSAAAAKLHSCNTASDSTVCLQGRLLNADAERRERAEVLGRHFSNLYKSSALALEAAIATGRPDIARAATTALTVAKAGTEVFDILQKAGPLLKMDWVSIGTSVLSLSNALGGMGAGDQIGVDSARLQRIEQALQDIRNQLDRLETLAQTALNEHRSTTRVLVSLSLQMIGLQRTAQGERGPIQCGILAREIQQRQIVGRDAYIELLQSANTVRDAARSCALWLDDSTERSALVTPAGVHAWFSASLAAVQAADRVSTNLNALEVPLIALRERHQDLYVLTQAALGARGGLARLVKPAASWREVQGVLDIAPETAPKPHSLSERVQVLTDQPLVGNPDYDTLLANPLNTHMIASTLMVVAHQQSAQPIAGWILANSKPVEAELRSATAQVNPSLPYWAALGYLALAQETLYRGEYITPLISELLYQERSIEACPSNDTTSEDADLCKRFGRDNALVLRDAARRVVATHPHVRANVATWRTRLALGFGTEREDGTSFRPRYGFALTDTRDTKLRELLSSASSTKPLATTRLVPSESEGALSNDLSTGHRWFTRLSGQCEGLTKLDYNARAVCPAGGCQYHQVPNEQRDDGKRVWVWLQLPGATEVNGPAFEASRCVLAPLPSQAALEMGLIAPSPAFASRVPAIESFLSVTAYYAELSRQRSLAQQARSPQGGLRAFAMPVVSQPETIQLVGGY